MATTVPPIALSAEQAEALYQLALDLLGDLVRIDTTNPPGNETAAALYLRDRLAAEGIASELIEPEPGRGNLIARMCASSSGTPESTSNDGLLLLSHLDVVGAEPDKWRVPPFSGEIVDGEIWGRGTLDTKNLTAIQAAVMILLKRLDAPLARDVILAATADEESGGRWGVRWLAENRLDLLRASAAINEGGGVAAEFGGKVVHLVQTAEKMPCPITVTATGEPGHASTPTDDNAVVTLSRALVAIGSRRLPVHITATYRSFVETLGGVIGGIRGALAQQLLNPSMVDTIIDRVAGDPRKALAMRAMIRNTATPTVVNAGYRINVIPGQAEAQLDCRLLPGSSSAEVLEELRAVLRDVGLAGKVKVEAADQDVPAVESPFDHPLVGEMRRAIANHSPGATIAPLLLPATTDGRYLRPRGIPVYGFTPLPLSEKTEGVHGHNERVGLAGFRFATGVLWDVISAYCRMT